jgi:hypothetical protein
MQPPPQPDPPLPYAMRAATLKSCCAQMIFDVEGIFASSEPPTKQLRYTLESVKTLLDSEDFLKQGGYPTLIVCKVADNVEPGVIKRDVVKDESVVTCSDYIEATLLDILEQSHSYFMLTRSGEDKRNEDECISLMLRVAKFRHDRLDAYISSRDPSESGTSAMKDFTSFMSLVSEMLKKSSIIKEQEKVLYFLNRMLNIIDRVVGKIVDEKSASGIDYEKIKIWFKSCAILIVKFRNELTAEREKLTIKHRELTIECDRLTAHRALLGSALETLEHTVETSDQQRQIDALKRDIENVKKEIEKLEKEKFETQAKITTLESTSTELNTGDIMRLVQSIRQSDADIGAASRPGTPQRHGGWGYKRVNKSKTKSKKYKKRKSKRKSKSKKYNKN